MEYTVKHPVYASAVTEVGGRRLRADGKTLWTLSAEERRALAASGLEVTPVEPEGKSEPKPEPKPEPEPEPEPEPKKKKGE